MKFRNLKADEIEVKIKSATQNGVICLLYKTARTDAEILDETVGAENWYKDYQEIKGNLYCTIYIWDDKKNQWIGKQDCGIESRADGEGNEKKGEASDAMKRAGFAWGIGRKALYSSPFILIPCKTVKDSNGKWKADTNHYYEVAEIGYADDGKISKLVITERGRTVWSFPHEDTSEVASPAERVGEIKAQILALANGDEDRIDSYCMKKYGSHFCEMSPAELVALKVDLARKLA